MSRDAGKALVKQGVAQLQQIYATIDLALADNKMSMGEKLSVAMQSVPLILNAINVLFYTPEETRKQIPELMASMNISWADDGT